ncbi:MAG TPA: flagellar motor protein MotA [Stellaceae bacterium]|nr:flagellar motor protein MotA [Stellaceae bacterium]
MTRPQRYLTRMGLFIVAVIAIAALLSQALFRFFMGNPAVNGLILGILAAGTLYTFRQVMLLNPEVSWIERFRRNQIDPARDRMPRLLAPMARMLTDRKGGRVSLSATSMRTLLDGIGTRLEEARETDRYLIGLLVFLGLLGTFYGLLETVGAVGGVLGALGTGSNADVAFNNLKTGLEAPLSGMSTAFSSSLFGLAGSLVLGFLDLQAGLAQNRFYNDLEEWLSGFTRLSGGVGDGDGSVPAYIQALLEQTADSLDGLQRTLSRGEESRIVANANVVSLTERLGALTDQMRAQQSLLVRLAEGQIEFKAVLQRLAEASTQRSPAQDESRAHLRNIELHLARLYEEVAQGRGAAVQELRNEIRLVARTIAALAEETER